MGSVHAGMLKLSHALSFMAAVYLEQAGIVFANVRSGSVSVTVTISLGGTTPALMSLLHVAVYGS